MSPLRAPLGVAGPRLRWGLPPALGAMLLACGGSSSSPVTPPATPPPASGGPTITITATGVSPKQVEVALGGRVTFTNQDSVTHEVASDPHPIHVDCPPINEVSALAPAQARPTGAFTVARTCGYHDHGQPTNPSLQGTIVVR